MVLFVGPIGNEGGPAIKNKLLLKYLDEKSEFSICNTYTRSFFNLIKSILNLIISKDKHIIVAVSRKGRFILYPILYVKKTLNPQLHYSTICIGGTIVQEAQKYPKLIKRTLYNADVITVETKKLKEELELKYGFANVHYMPNYKEIKNNFSQNIPQFYSKKVKFVFLSSIRDVKGVATMVLVFKKVLEKYPEATLDIYGPIRKDFDITIFDKIKNIPQINYKGVVENEKVIEILSKYHVFIFPTEADTEGFPAVLIEAYFAGLVVVASDINFNTEIVKDNINGWTFPTGNKTMFKKTILKCFNNVNKLKEISKNNLKHAENFNVEKIVEKYKDELIKKGWKL